MSLIYADRSQASHQFDSEVQTWLQKPSDPFHFQLPFAQANAYLASSQWQQTTREVADILRNTPNFDQAANYASQCQFHIARNLPHPMNYRKEKHNYG